MGSLVELAKYRKPPAQRRLTYFCTKCSTDYFRLEQCGVVSCGHCGAVIKNLFVSMLPKDTA